ncbi:hypothetical protein [Pseudonocardia sp. HH130630-07]|uniref:hypothetical protein n=1 Tax=Pseudonocardia sp. HH130630-07 TaxID=1690815 RepID=UPI0008150110|nr:hypothetical protein [Pseudonocardia sp. HH130630-07]ANY08601.1 hypothetical protein AFB00_22670 [Pseudonocardia sp. HH130630-07]
MIVDCDRCEARDTACGDCVIGVLMDVPEIDRPIPYLPVEVAGEFPAPSTVEFAEPERRALQVLADHGLIPHLQLVEPARAAAPRSRGTMLPMPLVPPAARHRDVG